MQGFNPGGVCRFGYGGRNAGAHVNVSSLKDGSEGSRGDAQQPSLERTSKLRVQSDRFRVLLYPLGHHERPDQEESQKGST